MQYENEHGYQLLNYFRLFSHVHVYHINSGTIQKVQTSCPKSIPNRCLHNTFQTYEYKVSMMNILFVHLKCLIAFVRKRTFKVTILKG